MEQVNSFHYLRNLISYESDVDVVDKLIKYLKITVTICSDYRKQKKARKLYNAVALPALLNGSENLTNKAREAASVV